MSSIIPNKSCRKRGEVQDEINHEKLKRVKSYAVYHIKYNASMDARGLLGVLDMKNGHYLFRC